MRSSRATRIEQTAGSTSCSGRYVAVSVANRRSAVCGFLAGGLLLAEGAATPSAEARPETLNKEADASTSPYIQELLKRSRDNKEQRDKERLQAYYKKNFKDYFEFEGGSTRTGRARGIKADTQAAIEQWLQDNK